ncbi:MAG: MFS transporter [Leptospiraceae bacterium]|nr:MFS transporter [Leptospiraceae bacterium]MDW7975383.1 MFS transporter [Leptospiraceae bacterium]
MNLSKITYLQTLIQKKQMILYFLLYLISYFGLGSYFVSLSPYFIERFQEQAKYLFFAGQVGYPIGYFFTGWLSDKTKKLRLWGWIFAALLVPSQYLLFLPSLDFEVVLFFSFLVRFLFAALIQITQIATLETLSYKGFSISRAGGTFGFFLMQITMFLLESFVFLPTNLQTSQTSRGGQIGAWLHILTFVLILITLPENRKSNNPYYFKEVFYITFRYQYWIFFVLSFFYYFSYQMIDFYLGAYFYQLGGMKFVYGGWILGVILEIPFFPLTQRLIYRYGLNFLFLISLFSGIIRFLLLLLHNTYYGGNWILFSQLLHGIHFTGYMAGVIYFFHKKYPEEYNGTAFGLFMVASLSMGAIVGNFTYGFLLSHFDYSTLFLLSLLNHGLLFLIFLFNKQIDKE